MLSNKFYVYRTDTKTVEPVMFNISQCTGFENKLSECAWTKSAVSLTCVSGFVTLYCCK